ncbi:DNA damage-regulated autophagy modulator protein 2-like [Convolutriloba macropyga]|uniref:DNA damage-regulated autophagy modulator protein 2-like n=1 Tax=Convolutriloba macropyga TaxID=536237 RepID=UPI003F528C44
MTCNRFCQYLCGGYAPLPTFLVLNTGGCCIMSYLIAYGQGHIFPIWPNISDTGTRPPESCYFGQLLNISAACAIGILFGVLRYWMIEAYMELRMMHEKRYHMFNKLGLTLITLASIGMSVVANFQETNVDLLHYSGAATLFALGGFYIIVETYISFTLRPLFTSSAVPVIRAFIGVTSLITIAVSVVTSKFAWAAYDADPPAGRNYVKWTSDDAGYYWHVASSGEASFLVLFF